MRSIVGGFVFGVVVAAVFFTFIYRPKEEEEPKVLSQEVTVSPTPSSTVEPTQLPTPTPTPVPKVTSTPKPTPTALPQPQFSSQEINGFIERFAAQYSVDPNVLRFVAICESGFNPFAQVAGYGGLYQFGKATWANIRKELGEDVSPDLRFNAEEAVQTAAWALSKGRTAIWPNCTP